MVRRISGVAGVAHRQADTAEQEPLKRVCVYVEAAAACALIVVALFALRGLGL